MISFNSESDRLRDIAELLDEASIAFDEATQAVASAKGRLNNKLKDLTKKAKSRGHVDAIKHLLAYTDNVDEWEDCMTAASHASDEFASAAEEEDEE